MEFTHTFKGVGLQLLCYCPWGSTRRLHGDMLWELSRGPASGWGSNFCFQLSGLVLPLWHCSLVESPKRFHILEARWASRWHILSVLSWSFWHQPSLRIISPFLDARDLSILHRWTSKCMQFSIGSRMPLLKCFYLPGSCSFWNKFTDTLVPGLKEMAFFLCFHTYICKTSLDWPWHPAEFSVCKISRYGTLLWLSHTPWGRLISPG